MRCIRCLVVGSLFVALATAARGQIVFQLPADCLTTPPVAVLLAGSFNDWSRGATTMSLVGTAWRVVAWLPDGRHYYRFLWTDARGKKRWLNDPANPCLADNGAHGANNFIDVRGGARVQNTVGLERFEWRAPNAKWVAVAGDFNDWYLGQFRLIKETADTWVAYLPVKRPFSYKFIIDGLWKTDLPERAPRVPNGLGEYNSFRAAAEIASPESVPIARLVQAGDAHELETVKSLAGDGDYGQAVALARRVAQMNAAVSGSTSPLVLRALDEEAKIHKRWNRLDDAAACWKRLVESNMDTSATRRAANELAAYYMFVKKDIEAGNRVNELALALSENNLDLVRAIVRQVRVIYTDRRFADAIAMADSLIAVMPPADGENKQYACEMSEVWATKGVSHYFLKQWDKAREALETAIRIHPWKDSQEVQIAQGWLKGCDRNQKKSPP